MAQNKSKREPGGARPAPASYPALAAQLADASSYDQLRTLAAVLGRHLGLEWYFFCARIPLSLINPDVVTLTNFPASWLKRYAERRYAAVDPTVIHARDHSTPLDWRQIDPAGHPDPDAVKAFIADATAAGFRNGLTVPVHGSGGERSLLNLATAADDPATRRLVKRALPQATAAATYLHEAVLRIHGLRLPEQQPLTNREKECLRWIAEGKTTAETAAILKITERTVSFHLQNAADKLQVSNRTQAIARAVSRRIIDSD